MKFDDKHLIEIEIKIFRELNGRHPSLGERQKIINRVKFNPDKSEDYRLQCVRNYFYLKNDRWPDELEYKHLLNHFCE